MSWSRQQHTSWLNGYEYQIDDNEMSMWNYTIWLDKKIIKQTTYEFTTYLEANRACILDITLGE